MLGEAKDVVKGPQGSPELKPLPRAEPLSSPGHQDFQGHHLPPGSPEAPLSGPEAVAAASKLSKHLGPGTGLGL